MAQQAIGMIECKGLCALFEAADAALKSANVEFTGWEKIGSGYVTAFFRGMSPVSRPPPTPVLRPRGAWANWWRCTSSRVLTATWKAPCP